MLRSRVFRVGHSPSGSGPPTFGYGSPASGLVPPASRTDSPAWGDASGTASRFTCFRLGLPAVKAVGPYVKSSLRARKFVRRAIRGSGDREARQRTRLRAKHQAAPGVAEHVDDGVACSLEAEPCAPVSCELHDDAEWSPARADASAHWRDWISTDSDAVSSCPLGVGRGGCDRVGRGCACRKALLCAVMPLRYRTRRRAVTPILVCPLPGPSRG